MAKGNREALRPKHGARDIGTTKIVMGYIYTENNVATEAMIVVADMNDHERGAH